MTESNIFFGTAFPEQTERDKRIGVSDSGQFVPVWKQEARDEKGRRRFHGAFTGGFSAGYFNTVGSKEGWAPSQFVSSRSSRNEQKTAKPEDFMDEEDLQELANSKRLVATEEFDILGGTERELLKRKQIEEEEGQKNGLSFLSSSLMDLVTPTKDSIGMTLLKKMGWKPGQGIGPRILQSIDEDDDNDDDQMVSLAPKDTPIVEYKQKTDAYGLGYDLMSNVPQVAEMYRYQQLKKEQQEEGNKSKKRKGRMGFGVGVFEDEDEDMMDYNMNNDDDDDYINSNYHRTLYDEDDDNNNDNNGYSHLMKSKKKNNTFDNNDHLKKKRCSDGHLPLKGFHVSTQPQELGRWFEPPKVPSNFDGLHESTTITKPTTKAGTSKGEELTMDARGALLGETPIEPRSVFDYMSQKSKEQLEKAKTLSSAREIVTFINTSKLQVTLIPTNTAQLALKGFIPFGDQPEKQSRYKQYLELCVQKYNSSSSSSSLDNEIELDIPKGLTHEAGMKEIDEFIKAARIFRPISSMMSNRFTSASSNNHSSLNNQGGQVEHITFEGGLKTEEQYRKEKELQQKLMEDVPKPKLSQEAEAAAMNLYGPLTRKVKPFYPNRLLCKRFNIKNPHPDYIHQAPGHRTQAGSTNILNDQMMQSMFQQQPPPPQQNDDSLKKKQPIGFLNVNNNDPALKLIIDKPSMRKDDQQNEMDSGIKESSKNEEKDEDGDEDKKLDYKRPAMDIFKAIFDDDDDDSDDNDEDEDEDEDRDKHQVNISTFSRTATTSTSTLEEKEKNHNKYNSNNVNNNIEVDEDSFIGPPLPPPSSSINNDHDKIEFNTKTDIPFKPKFIKREDHITTLHPTISDEKIHITTPFQPRLTSSKAPKRRRIQVSNDDDDNDDNKSLTSGAYTSDDDNDHSDKRHQKSKHSKSSSSKKQKSDEEDRSHRHKRKHDRKKKKKSRKYDDSDDSEEESKRREKKKRSKDYKYSDSDVIDEKRKHKSSSSSLSSSRHKRKNEKEHHHHYQHRQHKEKEEEKLEDDISLWEEKKPVLKRSRAEDLW